MSLSKSGKMDHLRNKSRVKKPLGSLPDAELRNKLGTGTKTLVLLLASAQSCLQGYVCELLEAVKFEED